ncbi:MAG: EamA family transporter RarD [Phenylobacterium sp.]|nr:MAG: EamA family transporter RarD [Phenylobacterium sp.]
MAASSAPGETRLALAAGAGCYFIWGLVPLLFQLLGRMGVGPWEILANRTVWAAPTAIAFVLLAGQGRQALAAIRTPAIAKWLALSSVLIAVNWLTFIWAVNSGRMLETALGYYLTPLISMAAGALIFRERIDRAGAIAIALAATGVAIQALAIGRLPVVALTLAISFGGYGVVRKHVAADAQTGLAIECAVLAVPGLAYVLWLQHAGLGHLTASPAAAFWIVATGPITAVPLLLFAWAARRVPLSAMGFLQFISPTMTFGLGILQGEAFTPVRALSFACIWSGAAVFALGAWRRGRAGRRLAVEAAAAE